MSYCRLQRCSGFTLVELSIVLVIIGLLAGGVLVGRDLIYNAKIRRAVKQVDEINAAVATFRLKYHCLPGDCSYADSLGFGYYDGDGAYWTSNGNGNGVIGECGPTGGNMACYDGVMEEHTDAWHHLSGAGLIPQKIDGHYFYANEGWGEWSPAGIASPPVGLTRRHTVTIPGVGAYQSGWAIANYLGFTDSTGVSNRAPHNLVLGFSTRTHVWGLFSAFDMHAIDTKLDDGLPLTGATRAWGPAAETVLVISQGEPGSVACATNETPAQYNVQYQGSDVNGLCSIAIKAAF